MKLEKTYESWIKLEEGELSLSETDDLLEDIEKEPMLKEKIVEASKINNLLKHDQKIKDSNEEFQKKLIEKALGNKINKKRLFPYSIAASFFLLIIISFLLFQNQKEKSTLDISLSKSTNEKHKENTFQAKFSLKNEHLISNLKNTDKLNIIIKAKKETYLRTIINVSYENRNDKYFYDKKIIPSEKEQSINISLEDFMQYNHITNKKAETEKDKQLKLGKIEIICDNQAMAIKDCFIETDKNYKATGEDVFSNKNKRPNNFLIFLKKQHFLKEKISESCFCLK